MENLIMSTTSISADQNITPSPKGSAKAIRLTVANPRLPGRREYNLQKVLNNPIHVTDPNIVDLFMVVLLKARQFSASDYLSQLTLHIKLSELKNMLASTNVLKAWLLNTLLEHRYIEVPEQSSDFKFNAQNLANDDVIRIRYTPTKCLDLVLAHSYQDYPWYEIISCYEYSLCCQSIQMGICEQFLLTRKMLQPKELSYIRTDLQQWVICYPPYLLLKALQAISDGEIANSPRDVFANVLRFLNENVSNVDLSSTKPEIATKDHDSYERPTFAVPTALEYEFFEGICGINDAALRFSTREYLAYLNMLEQ